MKRRDFLKALSLGATAVATGTIVENNHRCVVQILGDGTPVFTQMKHLRKGDVFRMFEPDGEEVTDPDGTHTWTALETPFEKDGVWGVEVGKA